MTDPTDEQLLSLVDYFPGCDRAPVAIFGSFATGNARSDSDVDLTCFVASIPDLPEDRYIIRFVQDRMVCLLFRTLDDLSQDMDLPEKAIWAVPGLKKARILRDETGRLNELMLRACSFSWAELQSAADRYVSHRLMKFAEEAFKLASAMRRRDAQVVLTETTWLLIGLPLVLATQRGIYLENESRAPLQVQESMGADSPWSTAYRDAAGYERSREGSCIFDRGMGALRLYAETVAILKSVLMPDHAAVVHRTVDECLAALSGR